MWQTLRSVSNNVNKRASILRFYRPALSVFDNAPARARLAAKPAAVVKGRVARTSGSKTDPGTEGGSAARSGPLERESRARDVCGLRRDACWSRAPSVAARRVDGWLLPGVVLGKGGLRRSKLRRPHSGPVIIFVVTIALRVADDVRAQLKRERARDKICLMRNIRCATPARPRSPIRQRRRLYDRAAKKQAGR